MLLGDCQRPKDCVSLYSVCLDMELGRPLLQAQAHPVQVRRSMVALVQLEIAHEQMDTYVALFGRIHAAREDTFRFSSKVCSFTTLLSEGKHLKKLYALGVTTVPSKHEL